MSLYSFIKLFFFFPCLEKMAFPLDLSSCYCTREEIRKFAEESKSIGVQYVGICCGNAPHFLREVAAVYDKPAPALKYSPEIEKHFIFGDEKKNDPYYTQTYKKKSLRNKLIDHLFEFGGLVYCYLAGVNKYCRKLFLKCVVLLPEGL